MYESTNQIPSVANPNPEPEPFVNKAEVGQRLGMRPRTIDEWMTRGLLPYYKLGRSVRFKWSEVERHLGQTCRVCRRNRRVV